MAVPLEVEEIAVGDYSDEYGHVIEAEDQGENVRIKFVNGKEIFPTKGEQLIITQGGRW
jgi:hypothetical protein